MWEKQGWQEESKKLFIHEHFFKFLMSRIASFCETVSLEQITKFF